MNAAFRAGIVLPAVAMATVIAVVYFDHDRSIASMPVAAAPASAVASPAAADSRLAIQVAALQEEVAALKARQSQVGAPSAAQAPTQTESVEAERALEAERHRSYMEGVAQSFAGERIDFGWAGNTSSRVAAAIDEDTVLRSAAHEIECRERTCRLQIEDDGSGRLSQRLSMMSLRLMDVLPTAAAELVDQGNGRNALVLYMSSQPSVAPPGPAK